MTCTNKHLHNLLSAVAITLTLAVPLTLSSACQLGEAGDPMDPSDPDPDPGDPDPGNPGGPGGGGGGGRGGIELNDPTDAIDEQNPGTGQPRRPRG